jgi:poly(glycerol-phosphate) alpha-glucosyltransferase
VSGDEDKHEILFLGRIHPSKGIDELLVALWMLRTTNRKATSWHLTIAGWGTTEEVLRLQKLVRELGLQRCVNWTGPVYGAQKAALFRRADVFVLPSQTEGMPITVLEAWSYGLPVLITEACNMPEASARGCGIAVPGGSNSLEAGLERVVEMTGAERRAMGMRGFQLVKEQYTWDRVASQFQEVYEWICGGGDEPSCVDKTK